MNSNVTLPTDSKTLTRDRIFLLLSVVAIFLFFELGTFGGMNLGFTVSYFVIFTLTFIYLYPPRVIRIFPYICGFMSLVISAAFALNDSIGVKFLSFFAIVFLYVIFCGGISDALLYDFTTFKSAANIFYVPVFLSITGIPGGLKTLTEKKDKETSKSGFSIGYLLAGLALSIPLLAIIIPLLRSDDIFDAVMGNVLDGVGEYITCLVLALIFVPFFFGLIHKLRTHDGSERDRYTKKSSGSVNNSLLGGIFIMLSVVYLIYVFSQLGYFFNAFGGILPEGYSTADYARSGFFEMCWVTVINLAVIFIASMLCKRQDENSDIPFVIKLFSGFLCFFDLFMIATALAKMVIYVEKYGLTRLRVSVSVFMIALASLVICLVIRLIIPKFKYITVAVTLCAVIFAAYALANMDHVIASYNITAYKNKEIESLDVSMIGDLSDGAIPDLYEIYTSDFDDEIKESAASALRQKLRWYSEELEEENNGIGFRNFNLSHKRALETLEKFKNSGEGAYQQ